MSFREGVCALELVWHAAGRGAWNKNYKNAVSAHWAIQFTSTVTPPFRHTIRLPTPKQTSWCCLEVGMHDRLFLFLSERFFFFQVCTCIRVDELSWKHAHHLFVRFCTMCRKHTWVVKWASIWNWPHCCHNTQSLSLHNRNASAGSCRASYDDVTPNLFAKVNKSDGFAQLSFVYLLHLGHNHLFSSAPNCTRKNVFFGLDGHLLLYLTTSCRYIFKGGSSNIITVSYQLSCQNHS